MNKKFSTLTLRLPSVLRLRFVWNQVLDLAQRAVRSSRAIPVSFKIFRSHNVSFLSEKPMGIKFTVTINCWFMASPAVSSWLFFLLEPNLPLAESISKRCSYRFFFRMRSACRTSWRSSLSSCLSSRLDCLGSSSSNLYGWTFFTFWHFPAQVFCVEVNQWSKLHFTVGEHSSIFTTHTKCTATPNDWSGLHTQTWLTQKFIACNVACFHILLCVTRLKESGTRGHAGAIGKNSL